MKATPDRYGQHTDGTKDVVLFSSGGKAVRFAEEEVRP